MTSQPRFPALLLVLALALAACNAASDALEGAPAGDDADRADEPVQDPGDSDRPDGGTFAWQRIEPRSDLVSPHIGWVEQLIVDPDDPSVLLVRFYGGVAECYGATAAVVTRTDDEIVVALEVGSVPPGASAGPCIDIAVAQEIAVQLDTPAGDAKLRAVDPEPGDVVTDPGDVDMGAPEGYVGLSRADAIAKAETEGRVWRIAREDGNHYALTMDYVPSRINFELDGGIVTTVWMG